MYTVVCIISYDIIYYDIHMHIYIYTYIFAHLCIQNLLPAHYYMSGTVKLVGNPISQARQLLESISLTPEVLRRPKSETAKTPNPKTPNTPTPEQNILDLDKNERSVFLVSMNPQILTPITPKTLK